MRIEPPEGLSGITDGLRKRLSELDKLYTFSGIWLPRGSRRSAQRYTRFRSTSELLAQSGSWVFPGVQVDGRRATVSFATGDSQSARKRLPVNLANFRFADDTLGAGVGGDKGVYRS